MNWRTLSRLCGAARNALHGDGWEGPAVVTTRSTRTMAGYLYLGRQRSAGAPATWKVALLRDDGRIDDLDWRDIVRIDCCGRTWVDGPEDDW